jgi:hypothetical protein
MGDVATFADVGLEARRKPMGIGFIASCLAETATP